MKRWRSLVVASLSLIGCAAKPQPHVFTGASFSFPVPEGYEVVSNGKESSPELHDLAVATRETQKKHPEKRHVVLGASEWRKGFQPVIIFERAPISGGTMGEPSICAETGKRMAPWLGKLAHASIIDGPTGKSCQLRMVNPESVVLITELNRPGETWVMTCNHADGDQASEDACRATLSGFRFAK